MEAEEDSLLALFQRFFGLPYPWFAAALGLVLGLLLALAAYAQGAFGRGLGAGLWPLGLNPAIIVYTFVVYPLMHRRWQSAMHALRALAPGAGGSRRRGPSHRGEWIALLLGSAFGLIVSRDMPGPEGWLRLYVAVTSALNFALVAAAIYSGLARTRQVAAYSRTGLELDVFDGHLLTPFARWGQSVSLAFFGGISLSLLFQSYASLRSIDGVIIYGGLIGVALTLFFTSVWTIHVALAAAQNRELARVRRDLAAARQALRRHWAGEAVGVEQDPYLPVAVCAMYERQVLEASTWPFNPTIVRQLLASAVAPVCVYVLKIAFGISGSA